VQRERLGLSYEFEYDGYYTQTFSAGSGLDDVLS
jgi:hypothetical protein